MCGAKGKSQADKFQPSHNCDACWCNLCICVDAPVCSIKVCFFRSGCVLKAIWGAWLRSCGLSLGGRSRRNTAVGCLPVPDYLQTGLMVMGRIIHGWHVFYCSAPFSRLFIIFRLSQVGRLPCLWCGRLSQLWGSVPILVPPLCPFIFPLLPC